MESAASISPRGRAASWYTFRAYLEKHLPYSIDESSRKHKNRALNIRNEKEKKKANSHHQHQLVSEHHCDAWVLQFVPVEATPASTVLLCTSDGYIHQASSQHTVCKLANGTLDGEVYHTKD